MGQGPQHQAEDGAGEAGPRRRDHSDGGVGGARGGPAGGAVDRPHGAAHLAVPTALGDEQALPVPLTQCVSQVTVVFRLPSASVVRLFSTRTPIPRLTRVAATPRCCSACPSTAPTRTRPPTPRRIREAAQTEEKTPFSVKTNTQPRRECTAGASRAEAAATAATSPGSGTGGRG